MYQVSPERHLELCGILTPRKGSLLLRRLSLLRSRRDPGRFGLHRSRAGLGAGCCGLKNLIFKIKVFRSTITLKDEVLVLGDKPRACHLIQDLEGVDYRVREVYQKMYHVSPERHLELCGILTPRKGSLLLRRLSLQRFRRDPGRSGLLRFRAGLGAG